MASGRILPYRDQCPCVCHKQTGVIHIAPCCQSRPSDSSLDGREAIRHTLKTTELWRDMDGTGTLQTYGVEDREFDRLVDALLTVIGDHLIEK